MPKLSPNLSATASGGPHGPEDGKNMTTANNRRLHPGPSEIPALRRSDHIRARRPGQPHHDGIYLGNGEVIHLVGAEGEGKAGAHVQIGTLAEFAAGRPVSVRHYANRPDPE